MKKLVTSAALLFAINAFSSGGNIGSSGKSTDFLNIKCNSAIGILMEAREDGDELWSNSANHPELAVDFFASKLDEAEKAMTDFTDEYSLVKRSIHRGLEILNALRSYGDLIEPKHQVTFLRNVYSFILDGVIWIDGKPKKHTSVVELDKQHRKFRNGSRRDKESGKWVCKLPQGTGKDFREVDCQQNEIRAWETRYLEFISLEVEWFLNTHTTLGRYEGPDKVPYTRIEPIGPTKAFTIPGEMLTGYLIEDFKDTFWEDAFECNKQSLTSLGVRLANFNNGTEMDPVNLIRRAFNTFRRVQSDAQGCGGADTPGIPR